MKIDFHFYALYVLCRLAGVKHEYSQKIAYASQHTDDAKYDHELEFISGGRFQQQMSAHKFLDLDVFSKKTGYDIFLPFHFLPGLTGKTFYEKLLCRENSETAKEMLRETVNSLDKPYGIHRLGIALHVYADTWSHQNFHGLNKFHNLVDDIELENKEQSIFGEISVEVKSTLLPPIGHAQAFIFPDEPYLIWNYKHNKDTVGYLKINNQIRTMDAAYHIYFFLVNDVKHKRPDIFDEKARNWDEINMKLREVLCVNKPIEQREELWKQRIKEGYFGFTADVAYDDREWFRQAVEVIDKDRRIYDKKENFHISDWKYFHDALTVHRFYIKNELLSRHRIIT